MSSGHVIPAVVRAGPEFITRLSPLQRSVLGVPSPGDAYWNSKTVELFAQRYPEIDTTPYLKARM